MNISEFRPEKWIGNFGVEVDSPGWLYVLSTSTRLKIGRTTNFESRLKTAKTWVPEISVIGVKPFWHSAHIERTLHIALSYYWVDREWFDFGDNEFREYFIETYLEFCDHDINRNSVDFIYWMNSTGMSEFTLEFSRQGVTLPEWRRRDCGR